MSNPAVVTSGDAIAPASWASKTSRDGSGGGNTVAILEALDELGQLEDGHLVDGFEQVVLGESCHGVCSLSVSM